MITGIDLKEIQDYVLKEDKKDPTVWKIGVIPSIVFMKIARDAKNNEIEASYKVLQIGLKGWDNFKDVEFKSEKQEIYGRELDVVPLDLIERIPMPYIVELSAKIMELNSITEEERKNS